MQNRSKAVAGNDDLNITTEFTLGLKQANAVRVVLTEVLASSDAAGDPRVLQHLFRGEPRLGVDVEQPADELDGCGRDLVPVGRGEGVAARLDAVVQFCGRSNGSQSYHYRVEYIELRRYKRVLKAHSSGNNFEDTRYRHNNIPGVFSL